MSNEPLAENNTNTYKNLTHKEFPKETNDYKQRIGRPGRKSKSLWKHSEEIDGKVEMCFLCFCPICSQSLPRAGIIWYGFADMDCSRYWRELQK